MRHLSREQLTETQWELVQAAHAASEHAYAPYSQFRVGAAWLADDGSVHAGSNYESASYGLTTCAERTALFQANNLGYRGCFIGLAVIAHAPQAQQPCSPVTPCGACRQLIYEAACLRGQPVEVICANANCDQFIVTDSDELLPWGFGPEQLPPSLP
ncbi:MAG: cytidine deaminase [Verrucomicrobia bacterium]|nr:cytidine deaminase [Verrucomicrobiota bacterium]